ncbi:stage II sporulation protein R [Dethiothermospora halolimnae]|uniref:stage II sporulation protein R n=1 Tax=Dethiothermospora halolimnae TaxID=3114390 RepID=UPI003CCB9ABC
MKKKILKGIIISFCIVLAIGIVSISDVLKNRKSYKESLIRFHVVANSDSDQDQQLKLKVRDKIIGKMNEKFKDSSSLDETRKIIENNIKEIEYIAKNELNRQGKNYDINVDFGYHNFPTKSYGNFTLPAGKYEAVNVVIGEGKGKNWWCVMFPPLCFVDVTNGLTDEKTESELKEVLTEEEYNMIKTAKSKEDTDVKLKFKLVEILEKGKIKLGNLF